MGTFPWWKRAVAVVLLILVLALAEGVLISSIVGQCNAPVRLSDPQGGR